MLKDSFKHYTFGQRRNRSFSLEEHQTFTPHENCRKISRRRRFGFLEKPEYEKSLNLFWFGRRYSGNLVQMKNYFYRFLMEFQVENPLQIRRFGLQHRQFIIRKIWFLKSKGEAKRNSRKCNF